MKRLKLLTEKLLLFAALLTIALLAKSCSSVPDDTPKEVIVNKTVTHWAPVVNTKGEVIGNELKFQEEVVIQPTFGQSVNFALHAGYELKLIAGVILLGCAIFVIYRDFKDEPLIDLGEKSQGATIGVNLGLFAALFIFALFLILLPPLNIQGDNKKVIEKEHYDNVIKQSGSSKPIWDSLENNCLIIGGSTKGCK